MGRLRVLGNHHLGVMIGLVMAMLVSVTNADIIMCDACVGITTEMCHAALQHLEVMRIAEAEAHGRAGYNPHGAHEVGIGGNAYTAGIRDNTGPAPMASVMAFAYRDACGAMGKYNFPPHLLIPKCHEMKRLYGSIIETFFETFHRKGINCARGVDLLCAYQLDVCAMYDSEDRMIGGVATTVYVEKENGRSKRAPHEDPTFVDVEDQDIQGDF